MCGWQHEFKEERGEAGSVSRGKTKLDDLFERKRGLKKEKTSLIMVTDWIMMVFSAEGRKIRSKGVMSPNQVGSMTSDLTENKISNLHFDLLGEVDKCGFGGVNRLVLVCA